MANKNLIKQFKRTLFFNNKTFQSYNKYIKRYQEPLQQQIKQEPLLSGQQIISLLQTYNLRYRIQKTYAQLEICPFCTRKNFEEFSNRYTMGINLQNGSFKCFRSSCQAKGQLQQLLDKLKKDYPNINVEQSLKNYDYKKENEQQLEQQQEQKLEFFEYYKYLESLKQKKPIEIYEYLTGNDWSKNQRGLSDEVLKKYLIGISIQEMYQYQYPIKKILEIPCVTFPMFQLLKQPQNQNNYYNSNYELVSCKIRGTGKELKHYQKMEPINAIKGIFGIHMLSPQDKQIIITEGEYDAMAAYQMTGITALSLPFGISHYPKYLTDWLNQFKELKNILLWVDDDQFGKKNCEQIAKKIDKQTKIIMPSLLNKNSYPKDANDCLRYFQNNVFDYVNNAYILN